MFYSKTESQFEEDSYQKAMNILQEKPVHNENLEEHLRKLYNERSTYASHIILTKKGEHEDVTVLVYQNQIIQVY